MSKPHVILVHPFPHDSRYWSRQITTLSDVAQIHAWDLPGFGGSSAPLPSSIEEMADWLETSLQASGMESFMLAGVSMGGYVIMAWLRKYGGDGRLAGLMLLNTRSDTDTAEGRKLRETNARGVREMGVSWLADQLLPSMFGPNPPDEALEKARKVMGSQRPEGVAAALLAMGARDDNTATLEKLKIPTLVICGSADVISPPELMKAMANKIPNGRYAELENIGHLASLEAPEQVEELMREYIRERAQG